MPLRIEDCRPDGQDILRGHVFPGSGIFLPQLHVGSIGKVLLARCDTHDQYTQIYVCEPVKDSTSGLKVGQQLTFSVERLMKTLLHEEDIIIDMAEIDPRHSVPGLGQVMTPPKFILSHLALIDRN
jgi:hypothetical protein